MLKKNRLGFFEHLYPCQLAATQFLAPSDWTDAEHLCFFSRATLARERRSTPRAWSGSWRLPALRLDWVRSPRISTLSWRTRDTTRDGMKSGASTWRRPKKGCTTSSGKKSEPSQTCSGLLLYRYRMKRDSRLDPSSSVKMGHGMRAGRPAREENVSHGICLL